MTPKDYMDVALARIASGDVLPGLMLISPSAAAIHAAVLKNYGRDWRRVKREVRKAEIKARRKNLDRGINRDPNPIWRRSA